jgi:dTDP-L-rhamnose 4-epimerase
VQANLLALDKAEANYQVFNVGTGRRISILHVARVLTEAMDLQLQPLIMSRFREGDVRHCYADISKIQKFLGYTPTIAVEDGLPELVRWVSTQQATDLVTHAQAELERRGLLR